MRAFISRDETLNLPLGKFLSLLDTAAKFDKLISEAVNIETFPIFAGKILERCKSMPDKDLLPTFRRNKREIQENKGVKL